MSDDERWMREAMALATDAAAAGDVPVGALIVRNGVVVSSAANRTVRDQDPTGHAELIAIREAARALGDWRLAGCTLYVTLEPCAMCAGAIVLARIPRLVFAAADPKAGMTGSLENLAQDPRLNHRVELVAGMLAEESGALLRAFFRERRAAATRLRARPPAPGPE
jgi:tRNA(adenine34) deaminase